MRAGLLNLIRTIRQQEEGFLSAVDYVLLTTVVVLGSIVGLATVRDAVIQELGDASLSLENLQQSYTVNMTFSNGDVNQYGFVDDNDPVDPTGAAPAGISLTEPAETE